MATAMFNWTGDALTLTQITSKANQPVSASLRKALEVLHIDGATAHFESLSLEVRSEFVEPELVDIARLVEEQIRPGVVSNLPVEKKENHMTAFLTITGDFIREVEITPIHAIANTYHIEFKSRLLTAKNPKEYQKNFSLTVDGDGLLELKALIERSLA